VVVYIPVTHTSNILQLFSHFLEINRLLKYMVDILKLIGLNKLNYV